MNIINIHTNITDILYVHTNITDILYIHTNINYVHAHPISPESKISLRFVLFLILAFCHTSAFLWQYMMPL